MSVNRIDALTAPASVRRSGIQLTRDGVACAVDLRDLQQQFSLHHMVRLPRLLSCELMQLVSEQVQHGLWQTFEHHDHRVIGRELVLDSPAALGILHLLTNTPDFLRLIERITSCSPISVFEGRIYRLLPGTDHYDSWHDDVGDNRRIGMSLNLECGPQQGGVFQIRKMGEDTVKEFPNPIQGDAIIFRISQEFKHRVTPVESGRKTAFAGWFISGKSDLFSRLREPSKVN